jgi:transcription-repair coupling factor (superfamily II helicase)
VTVDSLAFPSRRRAAEDVAGLKNGTVDIVIGTHR